MPLIYNSLECEHLPVQEKVLKTVPHLCGILDYGTVQNILLVKVAVSHSTLVQLGLKCSDPLYEDENTERKGANFGMLHFNGQNAG
jgi:hypothetical protein